MARLIALKDRSRYAEHAAPQSVEWYLAKARRRATEAAEEVTWLQELLDRRRREIKLGLWPQQPSVEVAS